jgi:acyl-coenzyme A thioesterase PaaI-like protein
VGLTAFDEATAVTPDGEGSYDVWVDERFAIYAGSGSTGAVNGGVLLATVLRAVQESSPHPYPVATSAHFLRVPHPGPARVDVTWLKYGKTAATARASLLQDGERALETTVTTGILNESAPGELCWTGQPPVLPLVEDCATLAGGSSIDASRGFPGQVDLRLDPATSGWLRGQPDGVPELRGYFRLRESRDPDAFLLCLAVDALPPVVLRLARVGWSPTVELTWHMRAVPAPGWLSVATRCRHAGGGWFDEESEVWDSAGRLVAQSRQLARVGRERPRQGA